MFQKRILQISILAILLLTLTGGCDDRSTHIAREAANRQAQQNTEMVKLNREVAGGTHRLVEADAQARKEIVGVHRDLQAERTRLDMGWNALEAERRQIAGHRRTESMFVPVAQLAGGVLLIVAVLGFCWHVLVAARRSDGTDAQLNELLVCEILPDQSSLLASEEPPRTLLGQSQPHDQAG